MGTRAGPHFRIQCIRSEQFLCPAYSIIPLIREISPSANAEELLEYTSKQKRAATEIAAR